MAEMTRRNTGQIRNRRRQYEDRVAAARGRPRHLLKAATDYFWGTFADLPPDQVRAVCDRLVEMTDDERRKIHGA